jgi:predicted Zn-ribbon and HTH transcriptional regulator
MLSLINLQQDHMKPKDPAKVSAENTLRMETIRQQVIRILQDGFFDVRQLSQELSCLSCNYVFKDRKKTTPPGHCPKCKKTHIERPLYSIE